MEKDFYTFEEIKDETFGIVGTPERDAYEAELKASLIGKAIKKARTEHNLTQTQLGEMIAYREHRFQKSRTDAILHSRHLHGYSKPWD